MLNDVTREYLQTYQTYQSPPLLVRAPGRINLIGEHTDYNKGYVLPAATDKALYFAMGRSSEPDSVTIQALNYREKIQFDLHTGTPDHSIGWGTYIRAILEILREKGYPISGVDCIFGGDIPIGAGMSSSAALCCGFIFGVSELFNLSIPKTEIALIAQAAEHRIGLNCGLMDQYAVLFGKESHALCLDCRSLEFDYFPLEMEHHALVLINSGVEHRLAAGSAYNERRAACETAVRIAAAEHGPVQSLRDVSAQTLQAIAPQLPPDVYRRAQYVLDENQRVLDTLNALKRHDLTAVGRLLYQSHDGLSREYEVSTPEMDQLVNFARNEPSVLGARMMGGGFGGCTINLLEKAGKTATIGRILENYQAATGIEAKTYDVQPGNGVNRIP